MHVTIIIGNPNYLSEIHKSQTIIVGATKLFLANSSRRDIV